MKSNTTSGQRISRRRKRIDEQLYKKVRSACKEGYRNQVIAEHFKIGISTVSRIKQSTDYDGYRSIISTTHYVKKRPTDAAARRALREMERTTPAEPVQDAEDFGVTSSTTLCTISLDVLDSLINDTATGLAVLQSIRASATEKPEVQEPTPPPAERVPYVPLEKKERAVRERPKMADTPPRVLLFNGLSNASTRNMAAPVIPKPHFKRRGSSQLEYQATIIIDEVTHCSPWYRMREHAREWAARKVQSSIPAV